jgi:hypothetical protein
MKTAGIELEATLSIVVVRLSVLVWFVCAMLFLFPVSAQAQVIRNDDDMEGGVCDREIEVETQLRTTGAYVPGATINIRAAPLTIRIQMPAPGNNHLCRTWERPLPAGNWNWRVISRPALSTSQLMGNGSAVTLLLDRPGVYKIQFTACPSNCQISSPTVTVTPDIREIEVRALAILPPETAPVLPPSAANPQPRPTPTRVSNHCSWTSDHLDAAWYTVLPWNGPGDYRLLEGQVVGSHVAKQDQNLNHDSQDWNIDVIPDPIHQSLINQAYNYGQIEVEWESEKLPERYRPTLNDRISAIGYWIYDCGHDAKTEIHPAALLAVHRPRAIFLPGSFGANVYVPGIVTDVFVSGEAGDITHGCHALGLHQQIDPTKPLFDPQGRPISRCLPDSEGFSNNPINRIFEFNIYLPRSPQTVMAAIGRRAPPVPLFVTTADSVEGQPEPHIEPVLEGDVTYLKVRIDLRNYAGKYHRRIFSAWAYGAPDNWGARRWTVRINSMDITDDADSALRGDGDWFFWVNTNNASNKSAENDPTNRAGISEWTNLFHCSDGCAHGTQTFNSVHSEIVLFPNQKIRLATSGYEEDWIREDSIAELNLSLPQAAVADGRAPATDGSGKYILHYEVLPGTEIGPAGLSDDARALYNAYRLTNDNLRGLGSGKLAELEASFSAGSSALTRRLLIEANEREASLFEGMTVKQIRQIILRAQREQPAKLDLFFKELNRHIQRGKAAHREGEIREFLRAFKPAVPADLWRKYGLENHLRTVRPDL